MATDMQLIPELDRKGLREFGLVTGLIVALLFGLFFPWLLDRSIPLWPWLIAGVLGIWALAAPQSLRPIYRGWMRFGLLLSRVTTPLILGIVFFLVILPVALVMRLFGHDPLARRFDDEAASYRVPSRPLKRENMEKPF
jgi:O-antigen/teichoic acid export membrane protein